MGLMVYSPSCPVPAQGISVPAASEHLVCPVSGMGKAEEKAAMPSNKQIVTAMIWDFFIM